jgi:uncharacterized protein YukJ
MLLYKFLEPVSKDAKAGWEVKQLADHNSANISGAGNSPPGNSYAVLKGYVVNGLPAQPDDDHYSIHLRAERQDYRVSVNVRSNARKFSKDLWFWLDEDFEHPVTTALEALPPGQTLFAANCPADQRRHSGIALDYIRMNLFERTQMWLIPAHLEGPNNDLNECLHSLIDDCLSAPGSLVYAFGKPWINEHPDPVFGFCPSVGLHGIHMNQGDLTGHFAQEDGVYQDGGLIIYLADPKRYIGYFTKFQGQSWHTHDSTGRAISGLGALKPKLKQQSSGQSTNGGGNPITPDDDPDFQVRIVAAMVNPIGPAPEAETVTLLNTTSAPVDLSGWFLVDLQKNKMLLSGSIAAGEKLEVAVQLPMQLSNAGGIISLINQRGVKIHGVSYTANQARREGFAISFGA